MPDLSRLNGKQVLNYLLNSALGPLTVADPVNRALRANLIRLADKALGDYEAARAQLTAFCGGPASTMSPLFAASSSIESCIGTLRRALRFARAIRPLVQDAGARASLDKFIRGKSLLTGLRNDMEHLDERIVQKKIRHGDPIMVEPWEDRVTIGKRTMTYTFLASAVEECHEAASLLSRVP